MMPNLSNRVSQEIVDRDILTERHEDSSLTDLDLNLPEEALQSDIIPQGITIALACNDL